MKSLKQVWATAQRPLYGIAFTPGFYHYSMEAREREEGVFPNSSFSFGREDGTMEKNAMLFNRPKGGFLWRIFR